MRIVNVLTVDAYRMIDALKDYADILEAESQDNESLVTVALRAAERIENGRRIGNGLIEIERFDLDAAHSAVIGVMTRRYEAAQELRDQADALNEQGKRMEKLLDAFTV